MKGFTLVELLIVFTFIAMLTVLGIAAYSTYTSAQLVQSSAADVSTIISIAKAQSINQVIPPSCGTNSVTAYEVDFSPGGQQYVFSVVCGTKQTMKTASLPPHISFASSSTPSVSFPVSTGVPSATATVTITGYGKTKVITVSQAGAIMEN